MPRVTIIAAADGSALGNPGPAGWGWYVDDDCWAVGGWAHGTNNMAELTAVLDLLQQTAHLGEELLVYCDSTYVINSVTKWMPGWKRRGWRKGDGKAVLNVEIMKALDAAMRGRSVRFQWVKGRGSRAPSSVTPRRAPDRSSTSPTCSPVSRAVSLAGPAAFEVAKTTRQVVASSRVGTSMRSPSAAGEDVLPIAVPAPPSTVCASLQPGARACRGHDDEGDEPVGE
jgi:ribonuclease HI